MAQAGVSRPASQMSIGSARVGLTLPEIQHPISRLGDPDKISVRGVSRQGGRGELEDPAPQRPLASEKDYTAHRVRTADKTHRAKKEALPPMKYESIPEGVEVVEATDPNKARLPVFGSRADMASRAESRVSVGSQGSVRSVLSRPSTRLRLEIDELEMLLREKMKAGFYTMRQAFKANDPEGKGIVSKEALLHILTSFLGRPITTKQLNHLLARLGLANKSVIKFDEFYAVFRESVSSEYPRWLDPVQRHFQDKITMSSTAVHTQLKEKAKMKFLDLGDLIPQSNPGGSLRILPPEFRNILQRMGFFLEDDEFGKLWKKYDPDDLGVIKGDYLMKKLGITFRESTASTKRSPREETDVSLPPTPAPAAVPAIQPSKSPVTAEEKAGTPPPSTRRSLTKADVERKTSLDIENWLKNKFREGFKNMKSEFAKYDPKKEGKVSRDDFSKVLAKFGLQLKEDAQLDQFFARVGLGPSDALSYRYFLQRYQDRSEAGMPHQILSDEKHRFNRSEGAGSVAAYSTATGAEAKLMNMFQSEFLALLGTFHKIDKRGTDLITQQEFRAAIESRFGIEVSDQDFEILLDRVPLNNDGLVKYPEFMAQFDTRGAAPSLFDAKSTKTAVTKKKPKEEKKPKLPDPVELEYEKGRTAEQLFVVIKKLITERFHDVEEAFYELDENNTKRITQDMMFDLVNRFNLHPKITRGEVRRLWDTFITNVDKTLDYLQFVRHFGYSAKSASFPNAKISPPKRGDNDCMIRSRKLNCAADMLEDNLRAKVDYMWDELRKEFLEMDVYHTGFVSREEFHDVLTELCVQLSEYEKHVLADKFSTRGDGRVSYIEFLKPFALRKTTFRHGNNMLNLLQHPQAELPMKDVVDDPNKGLGGITARLRQKLAGDWKYLRRAFKKLDSDNTGYLSLPEFRSVLRLSNLILDEDEVYHVMSKFDENMEGKIPYNRFLEDTLRKKLDSPRKSVSPRKSTA
ncbi:hypothetical protein Bbelb_012940 [Branchiostoma belcheri]|nr:hypothetical protein Bbelb_012940 [Branchiostoma belcheri]